VRGRLSLENAIERIRRCRSGRGRIVSPLNVEGLGCNQPSTIDAVVRQIVEILNRIDPDPDLHHRLSGRCKIDQQYFLAARGVLAFGDDPDASAFL